MLFPFGIQLGEALLDLQQFPIGSLDATGFLVGLWFLQFGNYLGLADFEFLNFLFQPVHNLLLGDARARSRLTLIRTDHSRDTLAIVPDGPPDILAAHLDLTPGAYVVRWQVLAVDGHITRGDVPFTVTAP